MSDKHNQDKIIDDVVKVEPYFVKAYNHLITSTLTGNELKVYLYLRMYAGKKETSFPSLRRMADEIHMTARTANTAVLHLEQKGYLHIKKRKSNNGVHNVYHILDPYFSELRKIANERANKPLDIHKAKKDKAEKDKPKKAEMDKAEKETPKKEKSKKAEPEVKCFKVWQENGFGQLGPFIMDKLNGWIDDFGEHGDDIVTRAIEEAISRNGKNLNYVETILRNWNNSNVKTVEDVEALEAQRQHQRNLHNGTDGRPITERMQDDLYWD